MDIIDVFKDIFTMASLTDAVSHIDYVPGRVGQLGIFDVQGIPDRKVVIEEEYQTLKLVPTAPFGGVPAANTTDARKARPFIVPHIPVMDAISAEEIQSVRAYANGMAPQNARLTVESMRDKKLQQMQLKLQATLEYHRVGAIKGEILDADGITTIYNLFTEFGVAQQTLNMALGSSTTDILAKIRQAQRLSLTALGNAAFTGWRALCGDTFFDQFVGHDRVEDKYLNSADARLLREPDLAYGAIAFGGVVWENYRGSVGGVSFVEGDKAYLFPTGVMGLFIQRNGPSDYVDRVNQIPSADGLPIEVRSEMKPMGKGIDIEAQMNPLCLCTKPRAVVQLDNGAAS
jgi:hypothetical protein